MMRPQMTSRMSGARPGHAGFSLVELMISIALGMLIALALATLLINVNRNNSEMARTNSIIENGRFAVQVLEGDLSHAGFWGGFVPNYDDLSLTTPTGDRPTAIPDPCLAYNTSNWNVAYLNRLIGVPIQVYEVAPDGTSPTIGSCSSLTPDAQPNTHVILVRHAAACAAGSGTDEDCTKEANGIYFQYTKCLTGVPSGAVTASASPGDGTTFTVPIGHGFQVGMIAYADDVNTAFSGINGVKWRAPVTDVTPTTVTLGIDTFGKSLFSSGVMAVYPYYNFKQSPDATLSTFTMKKRDCTSDGDAFKLVTHVYYVRNYSVTPGDGIPTLMRRTFRVVSGTPQFDSSEALVDGVEGLRVELGLDKESKSGAILTANSLPTTGLDAPVNWTSASSHVTPTNRGDGNPESKNYVQCTDSSHTFGGTTVPAYSCTAFDLMNAVVAKLYVLTRATTKTPGYTDSRTYTLGKVVGAVPVTSTTAQADFTLGPYNDAYKRHVYTATVRLINVSMRRDVPP